MSRALQARFYIDPATGLPHIHNHRVDEEEVIEVLEKADEDRPGKDGARIALGRTAAGRYLRVISFRIQFRIVSSSSRLTN